MAKGPGPECERCAKTGLTLKPLDPGVGGHWRGVCETCKKFLLAYAAAEQAGQLEVFILEAKRRGEIEREH